MRKYSLSGLFVLPGFSSESSADVVGEPDHGYVCISGAGH